MPASVRAHVSRATSLRPYDRRSPTASPAWSEDMLVYPSPSPSITPASPIQASDTPGQDQSSDGDGDALPDRPGLPTYAEYKCIEAGYLHSLSPRKRDKALITQAMFDKIWDVLHQPEACTVETPQFRFWVRKMFTLSRPARSGDGRLNWGCGETRMGVSADASPDLDLDLDPDADADADEADLELERAMGIGTGWSTADELNFSAVVLHENRPVAIMEQLYELFCYCHVRAGHGGRDKTCAVIREHYSWVPKELTAQFVKACPTCVLKRSGQAHGAGTVGMDVGMLAHRRAVGRGRRKGRAAPLEVGSDGAPVPVAPLDLGWPTTGGPLDPANPEPCGARERQRERESLCASADMGTTGSPSPVSPVLASRTGEAPLGSCLVDGEGIPRTLTMDASPFHTCDSAPSLGYPFTVKSNREKKEKRTLRKTGFPSLASAPSNESLHVNVNAGAPDDAATFERPIPPIPRPLRLWGPAPPSAEWPESPDPAGPSSYPFQIDPVLLFDYPGMSLSSEPGFASDATAPGLGVGLGMSSDGRAGAITDPLGPGHGQIYRLRAPSDVCVGLPALDPSHGQDSPEDASFEHIASPYAATLSLSLSTEFIGRSRCGSSCRDSLAMLFPCSAVDDVGRELGGPFASTIMTDT